MENLKLNETPVRTARNFRINNMKLENIEVPEVITSFENVTIIGDTSKINIEQNADNTNTDLVYGLSEELTNQAKHGANQKIKLNINNTQNKKEKTEAEIDFKFDDENVALIDNIEITANENTKSTVIIKYTSNQENESYHNGIIKAKAEKNSELNIVVVNLMNTKSNNFLAIENDFEENAKINYTIVDFGGKHSITNYYSNLQGDNCDNQLNTIYLGKENQVFDLNYIGELRGKKSNIDIEVQGTLKDTSKKHFKGTIDFKKGCKKATGNENEACMLLSDTAKSIALPMLLCSEEEVSRLPVSYDIEFRQVSFAYENKAETTRTEALKDISFTAPQGAITALVGTSGSGKSTVANLIPRFWDVSEGEICIGGINIKEIATEDLMNLVSFVFQDSFLFFDTLYENIRVGNTSATREQVIEAARAAQCHDFIESLPDGYNTRIGDKGVYLSGGESQRVCVARAILKNAPILVLDEATAFADPENEYKMQQAIQRLIKDKTVIIIAHRLSSIISAGQILVLKEGRLIQSGRHEVLSKTDGVYKRMWDAYTSAFRWQLTVKKEETK